MINTKNIALLIALLMSGCSSYNDHIDRCAGEKVGGIKRFLSYTPIGAVVENSLCAFKGEDKKESPKTTLKPTNAPIAADSTNDKKGKLET